MNTLPMRSYYLETRRPPGHWALRPEGVTLSIAPCSTEEYLAIYQEVGAPWGWIDRLVMPIAKLQATLNHTQVEVIQMKMGPRTIGFAELDSRSLPHVELAHLGLVPDLIGQGLGAYLLNSALHRAWRNRPRRVWVHTCDWDHPAALCLYRRAGFVIYKEKIVHQQLACAPVSRLSHSTPPPPPPAQVPPIREAPRP